MFNFYRALTDNAMPTQEILYKEKARSRLLPINHNNNTRPIITPPPIRNRTSHILRNLPSPSPPRRHLRNILHQRLIINVIADTVGGNREQVALVAREGESCHVGLVG